MRPFFHKSIETTESLVRLLKVRKAEADRIEVAGDYLRSETVDLLPRSHRTCVQSKSISDSSAWLRRI
jgi:hypothetical protein